MKASRTLAAFAVLLLGLSFAFAQSGRRIKTQPTPATVTPKEEGYSESRPYKPVKIYPPNYKRPGSNKDDKRKAAPAVETTDDPDVIKIDATLVNIPVSIYNRDGLYVSGLREEQFEIYEDGVKQEIAYFGVNDQPVTVALLIDTSPSTQFRIDDIRSAAAAFVRELNPEDTVMVAEFDGDVQVLTEPTKDREKIFRAIQKADFGGGTALYDAVEFALTKRLNKIEGRKAIVLFTDGVDTVSRGADYGENLIDAEESEAVIFPIYYNTFLENRMGGGGVMTAPFPIPTGGILNPQQRGNRPEDYALGKQYLDDLAAYTGGRVYNAGSSRFGLQSTFEAIAEELKRQYQVGYYPAKEGKPGERKKIKVRVYRPNLIVRARDSYIVGN
ncbi:MAG TPA: VWA domain-containing protein [Aridibacter sp.]|nr:VWA domain-containing protein [Aridibacter sp.]